MYKKALLLLVGTISFGMAIPEKAISGYWLVIGSYRQGPGSKPHVSGITSPSLYSIPLETLDACEKAGRKITKEIYKPVWQFDNKWSCIWDGRN